MGFAKDNKLVVNHDPVYKMRPMEYSKGDALTGLKLSNGENLPSLEQYLEAGKNCNTRLILELKAHSNKKRETKAVQGIRAMVKKMGLENRMEYITFSLHAMKEFIRLDRNFCKAVGKRRSDSRNMKPIRTVKYLFPIKRRRFSRCYRTVLSVVYHL